MYMHIYTYRNRKHEVPKHPPLITELDESSGYVRMYMYMMYTYVTGLEMVPNVHVVFQCISACSYVFNDISICAHVLLE